MAVLVRDAALGRGCGAVTLISGSLVSGDAVCCAAAGWEQSANNADVKAVEARKLALRTGADLEECICEPRDVVARHRERSLTTRQQRTFGSTLCQYTPTDMPAHDHD